MLLCLGFNPMKSYLWVVFHLQKTLYSLFGLIGRVWLDMVLEMAKKPNPVGFRPGPDVLRPGRVWVFQKKGTWFWAG